MEVGTACVFMPLHPSPKFSQYPHGYPRSQRGPYRKQAPLLDVTNVADDLQQPVNGLPQRRLCSGCCRSTSIFLLAA